MADAAAKRHEDLLGGLTPRVDAVNLGGKARWRVRFVGLPDAVRAQDLCAKLRARGQQCFAFE